MNQLIAVAKMQEAANGSMPFEYEQVMSRLTSGESYKSIFGRPSNQILRNDQLAIMEEEFGRNSIMSKIEKKNVCVKAGIELSQLNEWLNFKRTHQNMDCQTMPNNQNSSEMFLPSVLHPTPDYGIYSMPFGMESLSEQYQRTNTPISELSLFGDELFSVSYDGNTQDVESFIFNQ